MISKPHRAVVERAQTQKCTSDPTVCCGIVRVVIAGDAVEQGEGRCKVVCRESLPVLVRCRVPGCV